MPRLQYRISIAAILTVTSFAKSAQGPHDQPRPFHAAIAGFESGASLDAPPSANGENPAITSVTNGASSIPEGVPGFGIAQGSLFVIKGANLGPPSFTIATTFPLRTEIGGTSVEVSVAGRTLAAIMYYAGAVQVAAILPSSTPPGRGTLTVTHDGVRSAAFPFTVVRSSIGAYTFNASGGGDAIATMGTGFVGPLNAANPGDIVAFWATGLGPVTFDETNPAQQFDMTDVPVSAWIGGKPAAVVFRGRSACCSSVDIIYVRIPEGVGACLTPAVFQTGDYVSNTTSIPTAASGRTCTPTTSALSTDDVLSILSKRVVSVGGFGLYRNNSAAGAQLAALPDGGTALFLRATLIPGALGFTNWDVPHAGSCAVFTGTSFAGASQALQWLDAGTLIGVSSAAGPRAMAKMPLPLVFNYAGIFDAVGNYVRPGSFSVTAPGGADVGPFSATIAYSEPVLRWSNQDSISTINRGESVTVTWTGGDPEGFVQILGYATAPNGTAAGASFACTARTSDGTFTVPPYVTHAMPPSNPSIARRCCPLPYG
jgi:uncharacterized protein (TIGR03437 family)